MSNLQDAIIHLIESPHYKELADYKPPFNLFDVMSVRYRELTHSSVLAWLLADETNTGFTRNFLDWIAAQDGIDDDTKRRIKFSSDYKFKDLEIRCEFGDSKHGRIDIFVRFRKLGLAIAIEVKIWAGEQEGQIDRYQSFLEVNYHDDKSMVIFLTPWGHEPVSDQDKSSDVPVLTMSWGTIAKIINEVNDPFDKPEDEYNFRKQFSQHIKRDIVMDTEEKRIVRELLSDEKNAATIHKIFHSLPPLTDYTDDWKEIVTDVCCGESKNCELIVKYYPDSHAPRELKIEIEEWNKKAKLPFTLMLYKCENGMFWIRLLIWDKFLEPRNEFSKGFIDSLTDFEKNSNGIVKYTKVAGWAFYTVLSSKFDEIQEILINPYKSDWKVEAKRILRRQMLVENSEGKTLLQLIQDKL